LLIEGFSSSPLNKREGSVWHKKAGELGHTREMIDYGTLLSKGFDVAPAGVK
jgi:hypothetical protein